jgi:hypothetical protein
MVRIMAFTKSTPSHYVRLSRIVALVIAVAMAVGYAWNLPDPAEVALATYALALTALLGTPGQRGTELVGAVAIWISFAEMLSFWQTGDFDQWRWMVAMATLAVVLAPFKLQWLREMARLHPDTAFVELDRRCAQWTPTLVPHSAAQLSAMRQDNGLVHNIAVESEAS